VLRRHSAGRNELDGSEMWLDLCQHVGWKAVEQELLRWGIAALLYASVRRVREWRPHHR
jgi:hypothetical protein